MKDTQGERKGIKSRGFEKEVAFDPTLKNMNLTVMEKERTCLNNNNNKKL